ncbi:MAG: glycoside hydrolase family 20 zincin-like fold domain-containing protein, partial [Muribaculaceae bacterium]|nr:glycoside hydrolase family 20 zincin-like fold domain-containing protein [Muribaculaceae bacterium]
MNIRLVIALAVLAVGVSVSASVADYRVIPLPQSVILGQKESGSFVLGCDTKVTAAKAVSREGNFLRSYLSGLPKSGAKGVIELKTGLKSDNPEAYRITVLPKKILVEGASAAGVFYGLQTLRKSLPVDISEPVEMPVGEIYDAPRFSYRG